MTLHVDFVQNDWAGSVQRIVGRVTCENHTLYIKDVAPHFETVIGNMVREIDLESDRHPLEQLAAHGGGSYFTILGPHEDADCPFKDGNDTIDMEVMKAIDGGILIP